MAACTNLSHPGYWDGTDNVCARCFPPSPIIWSADLWLACCLAGMAERLCLIEVADGDFPTGRKLHQVRMDYAYHLGVEPWWED